MFQVIHPPYKRVTLACLCFEIGVCPWPDLSALFQYTSPTPIVSLHLIQRIQYHPHIPVTLLTGSSCIIISRWQRDRFLSLVTYLSLNDCEYMKINKWTADSDVNLKAVFAVTNTTWAVVKIRPERNSGLCRIWTHDLCNTSALVWQRPEFFSRPYFHYCSRKVHYYKDCFCIHLPWSGRLNRPGVCATLLLLPMILCSWNHLFKNNDSWAGSLTVRFKAS